MILADSAWPLRHMFAVAILAGPAFCNTILINVPIAQYSQSIGYAHPCCIGSIIKSSTSPTGIAATVDENFPTWSSDSTANVLSTVGFGGPQGNQFDPFVEANATVIISGGSTPAGPDIGGTATMTYYVDITNLNSTIPGPLPNNALNLQVHGAATSTQYAAAQAFMILGGTAFGNINVRSGQSDSFDFNGHLTLDTNTIYAVNLYAAVDVGGNTPGTFDASAIVDPVFTIADQYSSQYQILLSQDFSAVATPEPLSSWLVVSSFFAGLAWRRWRKLGA
jgi:hypothetical protein